MLLAANATPISQLGEVVVEVEIGEHITTSKMLVSDQVESIILGLDWLMTNRGKIDFETCVLTVMGVDIQLHHSDQLQKFYTCPRIRTKKSSKRNYVIKNCNGRREILAHVDKLKPVRDFDNLDPDQDRHRAMSDVDQDIEDEGPDLETNQRHNRVREPTLTGPPPCGGDLNRRPRRPIIKPVRYRGVICFRNHGQRWQLGRARPAPREPTPRPCKFCDVQLEGKKAQRRHVQEAHRDILEKNREAAQERRRWAELREQLLNQIRTAEVRGVRIKSRTDPTPGNIDTEIGGNIELNPDNSQVTVDFPVELIPQSHDNNASKTTSLRPEIPDQDALPPTRSGSVAPGDEEPQHVRGSPYTVERFLYFST